MNNHDIVIKPTISPIGTLYSELIIKTLPFWHKMGVTPNILTTIGLICSVLCVYFVYKLNAPLAITFLLLRMYFDYADGLLARKYKQTSKFGDYYDHIVDMFFFGIPLLIVFFFSRLRILIIPLIICYILGGLININIEKNYDKETGEGGNLLFGSFLTTPDFFNKYFDEIYTYCGYIILILILCYYKKK